ncbi:MAG TPA: serine/threonine-protein kinase [Burkholderiales bacterium]|nr:serine/threonine-protein kinase [Burkholderiales bacterium]
MEHVANYPVIRKLGEGATSEVFLCQDPFRGRQVAVKRIFPESLRDPARGRLFRKLFFTEASLAGKLDHPHIAQIYDAGIGEDSGYIVVEYVPGGTMERFCGSDTLLPIEQTMEIIFKCARALSYAHMQGVTHRDIKPGNLLYAAAPTDVRIGDFGLALNVSAETTQITGVGSPAYMSPEQIREELVDHRTDLYSLGVVMYQMLCGKLPFQGSNKFSIIYQITQQEPAPPSSHLRGVPEALDRIVRRAMQKDAAARYQSGDEFADDLVGALRSASGPARRESLGEADKFAALRALGFFKRFAEAELWEVVRIGQWQRVKVGTEIVREGEPGDFFCVLLEGEARVTKNHKLISVLGPGECFGEMAYLSAERRERGATVTASTDAHIVRVPTTELERASVGCRAHFDRAFVSILVERLNLANMRLTSG